MLVDWAGSFFKTKKKAGRTRHRVLPANRFRFSFGILLEIFWERRFRRSKSGSVRKAPLGVTVNVLDARLAQKSRDALKFLKAHGH